MIKNKKYIVLFVVLFGAIFLGIYFLTKPQKTLPIFNPRDVNPELVDSTIQHLGYNHKIADFAFTN